MPIVRSPLLFNEFGGGHRGSPAEWTTAETCSGGSQPVTAGVEPGEPCRVRSSCLTTLPPALRGSASTTTKAFGCL